MYIPVFITKADGSKPTEADIRGIAELTKKLASKGVHPIKKARKAAGKTLRECSGMIVFTGCCGVSIGMAYEIAEAEKLGIKTEYIHKFNDTLHDLELAVERLINQ